MISIMRKRAYDNACAKYVIFILMMKIKITFENYIDLYIGNKSDNQEYLSSK